MPLKVSFVLTTEKMLLMPFHAAEQHNKERISNSAEYPARGYKLRDFPMSPVFCEQCGAARCKRAK
jgi:hypothetical protein